MKQRPFKNLFGIHQLKKLINGFTLFQVIIFIRLEGKEKFYFTVFMPNSVEPISIEITDLETIEGFMDKVYQSNYLAEYEDKYCF